jgi:hypothetical protein
MKSATRTITRPGITLAVALLLALASFSVSLAQSPPNPPSRFVGSVTIDGAPAPAGTVVEVRIGASTCGVTTVFMSGGQARYSVDSPALDPATAPNCGTDGSTVSFYVGGRLAAQTAPWRNWELNQVDLTVTSATPTAVAPTPTPRVPSLGNTAGTDYGFSPLWIASLASLAIIGFAGMGWAAVRRG